MKLFLMPGACSLASHIVLEETGLSYETEAVDRRTKTLAGGGDYLKVNPKGYVPALMLDGGEVLTEGPAILLYLADQAPNKALAPVHGSLDRYRLVSWLTFIGTELHKSFGPLFNPAASEDWKAAARAMLERRLGHVSEHLSGKPYLFGSEFSVADAYLFTVLNWSGAVKLDLSVWPELVAYHQRVSHRPGVIAALKAEGLAHA